MPAKFGDILQAFEFADVNGGMGQCRTFVCRQTGKIYYRFDEDELQELQDDDLPDDIEDDAKYLKIPNTRDLGLGKPLVIAFAREALPNDLDDVRHIFGKRGAYQKFKTLLSRRERSMPGMTTGTRRQSGHCATGARSIPSRSSTDPASA